MPTLGAFAGLSAVSAAAESLENQLTSTAAIAIASGRAIGIAMSSAQSTIAHTQAMLDKLNQTGTRARTDTTAEGPYVNSQLALMENLAKMLAEFGAGNSPSDATGKFGFIAILRDQMDKVARHQQTITEAIQTLQKQFGSVYGTIQRRALETRDPRERAFLQELQRFINSGNLTGFRPNGGG